MTVRVEPIGDADIPAVAEFLHAHLSGRRVSTAAWARAMDVPWRVDAPNHGFMLVDVDDTAGAGGRSGHPAVVGVLLAFYADRTIDGRRERFCNVGAWCVVPAHRRHSLRLLTAMLAQPGYHFTDLSPSGNVVPLNKRLKFRALDNATALVPNIPWPSWGHRFEIFDDPERIEQTLTGDELDVYRDHARAGAARHLVVVEGDEWCYVMFRKDRRKRLPLFASILHVSNPELYHRAAPSLARHLLFRHGALASLTELRVVGRCPARSVMLRSPRWKMFRSLTLEPEQVDYLYSELVCVAW